MTQIHKIKCDKCGKELNLPYDFIGKYKLPVNWNCDCGVDFCENCPSELNVQEVYR